jgi:hypothetical protein
MARVRIPIRLLLLWPLIGCRLLRASGGFSILALEEVLGHFLEA